MKWLFNFWKRHKEDVEQSRLLGTLRGLDFDPGNGSCLSEKDKELLRWMEKKDVSGNQPHK